MGLFHEMSEVVNRTSKVLSVRFDGQDFEIPPNYTAEGKRIDTVKNMIPTVTVPYAKAQNVLMGSEDPLDPSEWETLIGMVAKAGRPQKDDISFCEQSSELTRVKLADYLDDPSAKIHVAGRRVSKGEARPARPTDVPFEPRVR
jgi:hypothetical protein